MKSPKPNQTLAQVFMAEIATRNNNPQKQPKHHTNMKTIKQLANIGAKAAALLNKGCGTIAITRNHPGWHHDEEQRQAFAAAVRDAVLAELVTKPDSSPVIVPLDMDDIRATDEFKLFGGCVIQTLSEWDAVYLRLIDGGPVDYSYLATSYLRRQHGSTEWKPCTKETK